MSFTEEQVDEVWTRWRRGEPARLIGRALGCGADRVRKLLAASGGVRPPKRCRRKSHLSAANREEISRGIAAGCSARAIAARLSRSASTVSREIARNGGRDRYRAQTADQAAWRRARRPKPTRFSLDDALRAQVVAKLSLDWSPQQIAMWLRREHPSERARWVSHETIYRTIFHAARSELGVRPAKHLRSGRSIRHPRLARTRSQGQGRLRNMVAIRDRPPAVAERAQVGHWEGDLVMGCRPSAVITLVERATRYLRVIALPNGYKADAVRTAITDSLVELPPQLRRSLTWDRGREMAEHELLTAALGMQVYFCDRRSPWQRGSNENANRLLRQYLAKGADLRALTQFQLEQLAERINERPRRVLGWDTAGERFSSHLTPLA